MCTSFGGCPEDTSTVSHCCPCCAAMIAPLTLQAARRDLASVADMRCTCLQAHTAAPAGALRAQAESPFGARVLVMDISWELSLMVCGDRMGNVAAFSLPEQALSTPGAALMPHMLPVQTELDAQTQAFSVKLTGAG